MSFETIPPAMPELPGHDCGLCGFPKCADLAARLTDEPALLERCIHVTKPRHPAPGSGPVRLPGAASARPKWTDSLGREYDFVLCHFPEDPGPREVILPHNPLVTRELDVRPGDVLIGRPLGMSCGCPITHCGVATAVDMKTGVITWCVTGPLRPRREGFKDLGYYSAEAYEGLIKEARTEIRIGARYFFQPEMCMLQWRHSGLVNYLNRSGGQLQVRVEGLWIG